ncbi:MAG TPA: hypothetical protein PKW42_07260, partial [bacterium]|nr:hypothetical protein [bacterium]
RLRPFFFWFILALFLINAVFGWSVLPSLFFHLNAVSYFTPPGPHWLYCRRSYRRRKEVVQFF